MELPHFKTAFSREYSVDPFPDSDGALSNYLRRATFVALFSGVGGPADEGVMGFGAANSPKQKKLRTPGGSGRPLAMACRASRPSQERRAPWR